MADEAALGRVVAAFAAGTGPVAVDAERASGYRYGQRAFLVQLRREGAGTALMIPAALPDLSSLGEALQGVEWVLHAPTRTCPAWRSWACNPSTLFDTNWGRGSRVAARGLGAVVEELLGLRLARSTRPSTGRPGRCPNPG